jgi:hypothetical protein
MFLRTMDSYPPPPQSTMKDAEAIILMWICEWCGPSIYAERYANPCYTTTGQSVFADFHSVIPFVLRQVSQAWLSVSFASYLLETVHHPALDGVDPSRMRKDGFRIIKALVDEQRVQTTDMMDHAGEMRPIHYVSPNYVAQVYSYMDTYSSYADSPPDRDSFLRKMVHRSLPMAKKSPSLFQCQLLPLAQYLADDQHLGLPGPETHTESHRNVCNLVTEIWTAYLRDIVQARPPTPNFALAPLRDDCNCDDCKLVNQFLEDPTQYSYVFRAGKERRSHIESKLRLVHGEATPFETLKEGNPHALVINKEIDFELGMELENWNDRAKEAKDALEECPNLVVGKMFDASLLTVLREDSMRIILGDYFSLLVLLKAPEYAMQPLPPTGSALTPVSGNASTTTSAKRKASNDEADMTEPKRNK